MKENKNFELEVVKIVPATIESNIEQLDEYMLYVKEKYSNLIFNEDNIKKATEDRASLNKLEKSLSEIRKKVQKDGLSEVEKFIERLKKAEKETKALSNNISEQIKQFEEKEWETKQEEISEIIDNVFRENADLKIYLTKNEKWKNKTFKIGKIEEEIEEQFEKLNKKYNFIARQLKAVNEEIENKLKFEDVQYLMNFEFDEIMKTLVNKKNEIKATEENIKRKAEEEKQKAIEEAERRKQQELAELEERKEREKQEAIKKAQNEATQQKNETVKENIENEEKEAVSEEYFDTTIRFPRASKKFLREFHDLTKKYNLIFELKENIRL